MARCNYCRTQMNTSLPLILVFIFTLPSVNSFGVTIDFTDLDRAPSDVLQIGGVTISAGPTQALKPTGLGSLPCTAQGVGLGSSTIGDGGMIDRIQREDAPFVREALSLSVDGHMESIVITPFFRIVDSTDPIFIAFDGSISGVSRENGGFFSYLALTSPATITIPARGSNSIEMGLVADFGNEAINYYIYTHPGSVAQFGYSINSLTYTPNASVADTGASTLPLLLCGCAALFVWRFIARSSCCPCR